PGGGRSAPRSLKLYTNSFLHLNNAVSINLGNNALQDIQTGAFNGLRVLKRLYLHENKLDIFRNDTFLGLESLEYLQADYNVIKRIESGAFRNLSKLRVLILNDNLIPMLPTNLFKLKVLSYRGMLDHIGRSLMEIQLEENPWNCTCEIVQLKSWLERIPYTALVGDITCETPFHFHGKDLREIKRSKLCPMLSDSEVEASLGIPQLSSSKENAWPTKPSSMLSSFHFTASSVEYKTSNKQPKPTKQPRPPKPPLNAKKLYLSGNLIQKIYRSDFWNFSSLDLLLNLRNNHFLYLPVAGVLEHLNAIVQIDLKLNPWDCTCDLVPLKQWIETISSVIVVGDLNCAAQPILAAWTPEPALNRNHYVECNSPDVTNALHQDREQIKRECEYPLLSCAAMPVRHFPKDLK
uniref:SLIT and NTRK like family member 3 n=1 Tax=Crocodylus porosus TaxID=8502 RepID=A0A7M4ENG6_CROPO